MKFLVCLATLLIATIPSPTLAAQNNCSLAEPCRACDGQTIIDGCGVPYEVYCDNMLESNSQNATTSPEAIASADACMETCDRTPGCLGVYYISQAQCALAGGSEADLGVIQQLDYNAFVRADGNSTVDDLQARAPKFEPRAKVPGACGDSPGINICPFCDGQQIEDELGAVYDVHCDSILSADNQDATTDPHAISDDTACLETCDKRADCLGVYYVFQNQCALALGSKDDLDVQDFPGYNAYVRVSPTPLASTEATVTTTITTTSTALPTPSLKVTQYPINNISCPSYDKKHVTDAQGVAFQVYCDHSLFADDVDTWPNVSVQDCFARCGNVTTCKGVGFDPSGNCELANGNANDVVAQENLDYTALIPLHPRTTSSPHLSPSMYPTGAFTSASSWPSPGIGIAACYPEEVRCPSCNGTSLRDRLNTTYTVTCDVTPICEGTLREDGFLISQLKCLQYCDADPVCFAATWIEGTCSLCQDSLLGFEDHTANVFEAETLHDTIVFLPETDSRNVSVVATPSISTTHIALPRPTLPAESVDCPAGDGTLLTDPASKRRFRVGCNKGLGAKESAIRSASDFAACAAKCTGDCGGIEFGHSTSCALYTSITHLYSAASWTAGIYSDHVTSSWSHTTTLRMRPSTTQTASQHHAPTTASPRR